jgi:hypothetical protein
VIQIVGFALFTQFGADLEQWMWPHAWRFLNIRAPVVERLDLFDADLL